MYPPTLFIIKTFPRYEIDELPLEALWDCIGASVAIS
jgi:hypothetical protein